MSRSQQLVLLVLVPLVIVAGLMIGRAVRPDDEADTIGIANATADATFEHEYLIPAGTAEQIAGGAQIDIVPRELTVHVGESIRIVNDDSEGHVVGVFYVGAGETLTKQFTAPGELSGSCTVHSDGEITLLVEA